MARSRRGRGGRGYGYERREEPELQPVRVDLHVHTPFSADYQDLNATYLQILQTAATRGLDMIALTDHNTVGGITAMRREIEDLTLLEELDRLTPEETQILAEYRRLLNGMLVLPGIEFTAAYGFHVLGVFPPETSVRRLEHLLLALGLTEAQMDAGSALVANTADVLTAYEIIDEFGGLVIPAHVDIAHGVANQGARYGEQTKIAYTQSPLIAALEVTDLEDSSRRGSATFFNGTRTDYPRQMHLIQGSNAHRLTREGARRDTDLGIGDRAMELMLSDRSFAALRQLFTSDDFTRERPWYPVPERPTDPVLAARESGPTITQAFHEQARSRRSGYRPVLKDVVAFANTQGGTIYLGLSGNPAAPVVGVPLVDEVVRGLRDAVMRSVVPRLDVTVDAENVMGKTVIVVRVPKGPDTPYATEAGQVFVRQNGETVIALRDEIVQLVQESTRAGNAPLPAATGERLWTAPRPATMDFDDEENSNSNVRSNDGRSEPPRAAPLPVQSVQTIPRLPVSPTVVPPVPARVVAPLVTPAASVTPLVTPAQVTPAPTPEPVPVPAPIAAPVASPPPPAPVPASPALPPITFETAPSVDTLVETVPGTSHPVEIPREAVEPGGGIAAPSAVATTGSEAADITEAIEAESRGPHRPPRRRPSRARGARSTENGGDVTATPDTVAAQGAAVTGETRNAATDNPTDALPVYTLEPVQESAPASPPPDAPSVAETGIVAEATGEESDPEAVAPAPRRRRRAPSRGKASSVASGSPTPLPEEATGSAAPANESETTDAVAAATETADIEGDVASPTSPASSDSPAPPGPTTPSAVALPTTGVEILAVEEHAGGRHYTIRDLTTGKITKEVTRKTARGPSRQAILAREDRLPSEDKIIWHDARGFGRTVIRDGAPQHDLALREPDGQVRIFYAVTNDGLDEDWRSVISPA